MKTQKFKTLGIVLAVFLAFFASLAVLPSSGLAATLPISFILAIAASFICREKYIVPASFLAMPLLITSFYGFGVGRAILSAAALLVISLFAVLLRRAVMTAANAKKRSDGGIFKKSVLVCVLSILAALAVGVIAFGNLFSALSARSANAAYVDEKYGEKVETGYTYYDFYSHSYLTKIDFEGAQSGAVYCVGADRDDYDTACKSELYEAAKDYFNSKTTLSPDSVYVYLDSADRALTYGEDFEKYLGEYEYLYVIPEFIADEEDFSAAFDSVTEYLGLSDTFTYRSITVAADNGAGELFMRVLTREGVTDKKESVSELKIKFK